MQRCQRHPELPTVNENAVTGIAKETYYYHVPHIVRREWLAMDGRPESFVIFPSIKVEEEKGSGRKGCGGVGERP